MEDGYWNVVIEMNHKGVLHFPSVADMPYSNSGIIVTEESYSNNEPDSNSGTSRNSGTKSKLTTMVHSVFIFICE